MPKVMPVLPSGYHKVRIGNNGIAAAVYMAGWPADVQATAVAVALAESSGELTAINTSSGAAGLFQILPDAHPDLISGPNDSRWTSALYNANGARQIYEDAKGFKPWEAFTNGSYLPFMAPAQLAVAAVNNAMRLKTSDGTWLAYRDLIGPEGFQFDQILLLQGAFQGLKGPMEDAGKAINDAMATGGAAAGSAAADVPIAKQAAALGSLAELAIGAAKWLADQKNWVRIAQVAVGGALAIGALVVVARPMVSGAANTVSKLKPI